MINKKLLWFAVLLIVIGVIAWLFSSGVVARGPMIADGIALYRTVLADKPTTQGFVYIPFARTDTEFSYVNVGIDVNGDGAILAYDSADGRQEEWVVQNDYPEIFEGEANRFAIDVIDSRFGTTPIKGVAVLSTEAFPTGTWSKEREGLEKKSLS